MVKALISALAIMNLIKSIKCNITTSGNKKAINYMLKSTMLALLLVVV